MVRSHAVRIALAAGLGLPHATGLAGQAPERTPMTVDDVLELARPSQVRISPDGRWVAWVVSSADTENDRTETDLWVAPAAGGPEDARRLTFRPGTDDSPLWQPTEGWLAFASDRAGDRQLFGIRPDGGEAWQVTDHETPIGGFRFAPDGTRLGFTASPKTPEEDEKLAELRGRPIVWDSAYADEWSHLYVAELAEGEAGDAVRWTPDGHHVQGFVWSPDARRIAYAARPSPVLRTYRLGGTWVQDGPEAEPRPVGDLPGGDAPVAWSEEAGLILAGSGHALGTHNGELWSVLADREGAAADPISLTEALDENAGFVGLHGGRLLIETAHRTGRRLYTLDLETSEAGRPAPGTLAPVSDDARFYGGFSATEAGDRVAFVAEDGTLPPDVFTADLDAFEPRRLSETNPQVERLALGEQRVVRWTSRADGEPIEGILTLPVGYDEGDRVPLVLVIHGGPSGVSSDRFHATRGAYPVQVYAGMGFATLQPNYRGSTGYGERFRGLNRGDISGRDWIDVDSGVDAMIEEGIADPERLAVSGWSFGGHHTYWGITRTDRYRAASAGAGANDLISMYSQTDLPEFYHTYLGPKPWEDWELYEERSAYRHVENVTTPLLIQVGERDERVPAEQSIQFFEAVRAIGKAPAELVIYPGQPHGIRSPRLRRDLMSRNVGWLERWVLGAPSSSTSGAPR